DICTYTNTELFDTRTCSSYSSIDNLKVIKSEARLLKYEIKIKILTDENNDKESNIDENNDKESNIDENNNKKSNIDENSDKKSNIDENNNKESNIDENNTRNQILMN
ncbi:26355_t:CDS:1, partial [Dentiscutata erythropus]